MKPKQKRVIEQKIKQLEEQINLKNEKLRELKEDLETINKKEWGYDS